MLDMDNVNILMKWDIKDGRDQDYFEFVVREFVPGIGKLGLEPTGAWYTAYSSEYTPQIMAEFIADDLESIRRILSSPEWERLKSRLLTHIDNYSHKVVRVSGGFQL